MAATLEKWGQSTHARVEQSLSFCLVVFMLSSAVGEQSEKSELRIEQTEPDRRRWRRRKRDGGGGVGGGRKRVSVKWNPRARRPVLIFLENMSTRFGWADGTSRFTSHFSSCLLFMVSLPVAGWRMKTPPERVLC